MALISTTLRRNRSFQGDFRRLLEAPLGLVDALCDTIDAREPRPAKEDLAGLAERFGVPRETAESADSVLRYLVKRVTVERLSQLDSELKDLAESISAAPAPELSATLKRRFSPESPAVRAESEVRALKSQGGAHDMRFRPTVVLSEDAPAKAFAGLLCELHYHDSDDNHHDLSFTVTPSAAAKLLQNLTRAVNRLERLRAEGTVAIANTGDPASSDAGDADD